jgi:hypothetical protein
VNSDFVTAPEHIAACDLGPAIVLTSYLTGEVRTLHGAAATWWTELAATGDTTTPLALDPQSARSLLDQLFTAGLLVRCTGSRPWEAPVPGQPITPSWGTHETQAGSVPIPRVPYRLLPAAAIALAIVLTVVHGRPCARMARLTRLLTWANRRTRRPASTTQANQAVHAVRRVGLLAPSRVACLEESAAATLMLAMYRRRVTWCHGAAADPIRLHAWVETDDGQPVAEPDSTRRYTKLRVIPDAKGR